VVLKGKKPSAARLLALNLPHERLMLRPLGRVGRVRTGSHRGSTLAPLFRPEAKA
jgi:hypothetical protein